MPTAGSEHRHGRAAPDIEIHSDFHMSTARDVRSQILGKVTSPVIMPAFVSVKLHLVSTVSCLISCAPLLRFRG